MNATVAVSQATTATIADLVLVRYALPNTTPKKVREDIGKLLPAEPSTGEFDDIRAELASAGFLSSGRRNSFSLTDAGRQRAMRFLGLSELPPRSNWGTVIAKHLFPKAIGLSGAAAAKLDTSDRLAGYILKRKYGIFNTTGSTVKQVLEAITCKTLGYPQETTLAGLLRAVLSEQVNSTQRLTKDQLAQQLPLFETGLSQISTEEARRILVREWLVGTVTATPSEQTPQAEPFDLTAFASTVLALAANSPPEDRFHDNKVFIAALWRTSQREYNFPHLSLPDFKQHLLEANARHLLHLSRADLVQAMDQHLVAESETVHLNATFHFVLLQEFHQ